MHNTTRLFPNAERAFPLASVGRLAVGEGLDTRRAQYATGGKREAFRGKLVLRRVVRCLAVVRLCGLYRLRGLAEKFLFDDAKERG